MIAQTNPLSKEWLNVNDVTIALGISKTTVYNYARGINGWGKNAKKIEGFPKPIKDTRGKYVWSSKEILAWKEEKMQQERNALLCATAVEIIKRRKSKWEAKQKELHGGVIPHPRSLSAFILTEDPIPVDEYRERRTPTMSSEGEDD